MNIISNCLDIDEITSSFVVLRKIYLDGASLMLRSTVASPYRGTRYHLEESQLSTWKTRNFFNHRHASLRSAIKKAFGVLKKHFPTNTIRIEPQYPFDTQTDITLACCILHNFLMSVDPYDRSYCKSGTRSYEHWKGWQNEVDQLERNMNDKCEEQLWHTICIS